MNGDIYPLIVNKLIGNMTLILVPIFFYQIFYIDFRNKFNKYNRFFMMTISGLSILFCMMDTIPFPNGTNGDLRYLPLISSMLYGGWKTSTPLCLLILCYTYFFTPSSLWTGILTILFMFALIPYIRKKFHRHTIMKKAFLASVYSFFFSLFVVAHYLFSRPHGEDLLYLLLFLVSQAFTIWLSTYFYESIGRAHALTNQLVASENLKVVSELASSTSHDIRNPLTVAKGLLQLMRVEDYSKEKRKQFIDLSIDELTHAEALINDYLSLAKPDLMKHEVINLANIATKAMNMIQPYAHLHNVKVESRIEDSTFIKGNPHQLYRVLINLAKNSIEAMPKGGTLTLQLTLEPNNIVLCLTDTGTGMTPDEIQRLGKPYYTTKQSGTGLGMLAVFNFIQSMNGNIEIQSTKGIGTQMIIRFPYAML